MTDHPNHGTVPLLLKFTVILHVTPYSLVKIIQTLQRDLLPTSSEQMVETYRKQNSNNRRNRWLESMFVRKPMKNSRPAKGCFVTVWLTVLPCIWKKIPPNHWFICYHNTGHCNIDSYHTDNLKTHTYLLQFEVSATVVKQKAQTNAHTVHCRSMLW